MNAVTNLWPAESVCLRPASLNIHSVAADLYERTCRVDFDQPGFCLLNVGRSLDSVAFRQLMVNLKRQMAELHESNHEKTLHCLSASRFDQQTTTKPHLEGGPNECFLMLGYEPSEVNASLEISDYAKCAFDLGLTPNDFMERHNPMFSAGYEMLRPYTTSIPCFACTDYQIICINNSSAPHSREHPAWQGTLHTAAIHTPDDTKRRVVNSMMIAPATIGTPEPIGDGEQAEFVSTSVVRRRGYDKTYLTDDE